MYCLYKVTVKKPANYYCLCFNNKGEVTLTALAPSATPQIPRLTPVSCHAP